MSERIDALVRLNNALEDFLESGWQSEGSGDRDDPHAGMDPDDLACDSVDAGGDIHKAVCAVQSVYGGKLPAPGARMPWLQLQHACRREADPYKRQIEAHQHAR